MQILNPIKMLEFLKDKIYVGFFGNQVLQQSVVCMSMKLSTKMVKFMAHGSMVLALGCGQYDNMVKMC